MVRIVFRLGGFLNNIVGEATTLICMRQIAV